MPPDLAHHAVTFLLVLVRLSGLVLTAPLLTGAQVPRRVKAVLLLTSSAAVHAGLGGISAPAVVDIPSLLPLVLGELLVGGTIGIIAGLPLAAFDAAGHLLGHQMGLGIAASYDPESGVESDAMSRLLHMLALGAFLSLGGPQTLFGIVAGTYAAIPPGGLGADRAPLDLIVTMVGAGLEIALRAAAPALCTVLVALLVIGVLMKSAPQINVMSVGFAIKIVAGLTMTAFSLRAVDALAADEVRAAFTAIREWIASF